MSFATILRELREERSLNQKQLAEACKLSTQCISALETGTRNPTGSTIKVLAQFFEVSSDYLLEIEDDFGQRVTSSSNTYSAEERQLIENYRALSPALKEMLQDTIKTWSDSTANKRTKKDA